MTALPQRPLITHTGRFDCSRPALSWYNDGELIYRKNTPGMKG